MDKQDISYQLTRLRTKVNDILADAEEILLRGAINWGNLRCIAASYVVDDRGDEGYEVLIEEASPDNPELADFISYQLDGTEFSPLEIRFEW